MEAIIMESICAFCGEVFEGNTMYCCGRCKDNASKVRRGIKPTTIKVKVCPICGVEFETVYDSKIYCGQCDGKKRKYYRPKGVIPWEEYVDKVAREAEERAKKKRIEKEWYVKIHTVERKCAYCGESFFIYDKLSNVTCSPECSKKYKNMKHGHNKRIPKDQLIDKDITLKKLFKRDNGRCYLCGCECSFDDWSLSKKGNLYPGATYPEIEHMIPISRGGLHSWNNVRLSCHRCNHDKGDDVVIASMNNEFAYSEKRSIEAQCKKTIQMDLEGNILRVWDSTAQIKRELGLNDKHIQNVCRKAKGTAYGFVWRYA